MLSIIYDSRCFDYGQIMSSWTGIRNKLQDMVTKANFTFASDYASEVESSAKSIAKFIDEFEQVGS